MKSQFFLTIALVTLSSGCWAQEENYIDPVVKDSVKNQGAFYLKSGYLHAMKPMDNFSLDGFSLGAGVEAHIQKWVIGTEIDFSYQDIPANEKFFTKLRTPFLKVFVGYSVFDKNIHRLYTGFGLGYFSAILPDYSNDLTTPNIERYEQQNFFVISGRLNYKLLFFDHDSNKLMLSPELYVEGFLPIYGYDISMIERAPKIPGNFRALGAGISLGLRLNIGK